MNESPRQRGKRKPGGKAARGPEKSQAPRWRRRLRLGLLLALPCWLLLSWFVARPRLERWLGETFEGSVHVSFALVWPNADVTAFGLTVKGEHHALSASRAHVDVRLLGLFGARPIAAVSVSGLIASFDTDAPVRIFRDADEAGSADGGVPDPDPPRLPPLRFADCRIELREPGGASRTMFKSDAVAVTQAGERLFRGDAAPGVLARVPFERLTGRILPRAGRLLVDDLKMRSFNGMVRGYLDIDAAEAGACNGELEWHFAEVEEIWRAYGLSFAEKRRGDLSGRVVFEARRPELAALKAKGSIALSRGRFYSPVSFKIFLVLGLPVLDESWIHGADLSFSIEEELCYLESATISGGDYTLEGRGIFSFDGACDLEMKHGGTILAVSGALEDPVVRVLPLSGLTAPFERMFRDRIRPRKEPR